MSTQYNEKYARSRFQAIAMLNGIPEIDYFSSRFQEAILRVKTATPYMFSQGDKVVNISHRAYGTTSLWWVIMLYNGFVHPYDVSAGDTLRIPDLYEITRAIAEVNVPRIGEVIEL